MKINNIGRLNVNPYQQVGKMEQVQKTNKKDKIEISSEAMNLQKIGNIELQRQEKIDSIKKNIQSGQYEVNPKEIAKKMYSFWDDMK